MACRVQPDPRCVSGCWLHGAGWVAVGICSTGIEVSLPSYCGVYCLLPRSVCSISLDGATLCLQIMKEDDNEWPAPDRVGRQELEIVMGQEHISFCTTKLGSIQQVQTSKDPDGMRIFYYLVQVGCDSHSDLC